MKSKYRNAGRPLGSKNKKLTEREITKKVTITMTPSELEKLKKIASEKELSLSKYLVISGLRF